MPAIIIQLDRHCSTTEFYKTTRRIEKKILKIFVRCAIRKKRRASGGGKLVAIRADADNKKCGKRIRRNVLRRKEKSCEKRSVHKNTFWKLTVSRSIVTCGNCKTVLAEEGGKTWGKMGKFGNDRRQRGIRPVRNCR